MPATDFESSRYPPRPALARAVDPKRNVNHIILEPSEVKNHVAIEWPIPKENADRLAVWLKARQGLVSTMRIFTPDMDVRWMWRPNGTSIAGRLWASRKTFDVPKASDMFASGHTLMAQSDLLPEGRVRLTEMRDWLMIGILACRPLRRHTMWELRLGEHLVRTETSGHLILKSETMKNRRPVEFDLPASLSSRIDQYVTDVRPKLLQGAKTEGL